MLIAYLTVAVAGAIVLVLAGYLMAIAWALARAQRNVARLADGLEAVARATDPLADRIGTVAGVLTDLDSTFAETDRNLGSAVDAFIR